jgi:hypothetical protein
VLFLALMIRVNFDAGFYILIVGDWAVSVYVFVERFGSAWVYL